MSEERFGEKSRRVVCAALRYEDGFIVAGVRHCDMIMQPQMQAVGRRNFVKAEQGFLDNRYNFLTRKEAAELAMDAGQITRKPDILFSEDLY